MDTWAERNSPADIVESAAGQNIPAAPALYNVQTDGNDIHFGAHGTTPEEKPKGLSQKVFLMSKELEVPITGEMVELGSNVLIAGEVAMKAHEQGKSMTEIKKARLHLK